MKSRPCGIPYDLYKTNYLRMKIIPFLFRFNLNVYRNYMLMCLFMILSLNSLLLTAGNDPKELTVYKGKTPVLDGNIATGEYDDATVFGGTGDWFHFSGDKPEFADLHVKAWVKHDGKNLYFAFDVTDDVIYGVDVPRWLPDQDQKVHEFTPDHGWPWFGDGIEIFLNPRNTTEFSKIDGKNGWIVACSTHKSIEGRLDHGGLIDGEPKNDFAWNIYRQWIKSGVMKAAVHIKTGVEGKGYVIEWKIAFKPCLEVADGKFWNPEMGATKMGLNFEIQDLDEKEKGAGNFANMHHIEVWEAEKTGDGNSKAWGSLILNPRTKPIISRLSDKVNLFIGTTNGGNVHPGAVLPWGMVSLSPLNAYDTISKSANSSPYYIDGKYISGFTHLNMNGTGCPDMGTFCLMPTTGNLSLHQPYNTSHYSNEYASPGYYAVHLNKFNINAEVTTTLRTGLSRFTFPEGKANILLNLGVGLTTQKGGSLKKVSDTEVEGFKTIGNLCGITNVQTIYFVAQISKKPVESGIWIDGRDYPGYNREIAGNDIGAYFSFNTQENESINVKVGVSYVSMANARKNLEAEQPGFDFAGTQTAAELAWNNELSKIQVEGGTKDDQVKFYSALYHALIQPSFSGDVDGQYCTMGSNKVGNAIGYNRRTVFSLWDTYRNVHPFLSLVYPKQQSDIVKTMLGMYQEGGWLPKWEYAGIESYDMVGDPGVPVIADAWLRGIKDFDINLAYVAMKHNASESEGGNPVRPGLTDYLKFGYIPLDATCVFNPKTPSESVYFWENLNRLQLVWGPVSTAMEYCIADWNIAQVAKSLGKTDDHKVFTERSMYYKNYFDKETNFIRPKLKDGSWLKPFDFNSEKGFTEGNTWTYTFMVNHDIPGLMQLMGGPKPFIQKLTECFETDHFFMANEPDIAYPYLFNYAKGEEWRTQKQVRDCVNKYFKNAPDGIWGNDDCGTMSTWLMYSMMGFYPDCPGNMDYQLASPVFSKITIALDPTYYPGKTFVIEAKNAGKDNCYIQSMELNGKPYKKFTLNHEDIVRGGKLSFKLSDKK